MKGVPSIEQQLRSCMGVASSSSLRSPLSLTLYPCFSMIKRRNLGAVCALNPLQLMSGPYLTSLSRFLRGPLLAVFCAILVTFTATIQIVHAHDLDPGPHPECSLCAISHATISPAAPIELPAVKERVEELRIEATEVPRDLFVFSFYSRPPPAETASL